ADLRPKADLHLRARTDGVFRDTLFHGALVEARPQDLHRRVLVLVLRALVLALHDEAGRQVRDPDRRLRLVDVLSAFAARPERVDPEVLVADLDFDRVVDLRRDIDRGERRVAPGRGLGPAGTGVNLDERGQRVLVVRELEGELLAARPRRDRGERLVGVRLDLLARAQEIAEDLELLLPFLEVLVVREDALGALQLAERLLRLEGIRPETGFTGLPFELFFLFRRLADVKDSPGGRSRTT